MTVQCKLLHNRVLISLQSLAQGGDLFCDEGHAVRIFFLLSLWLKLIGAPASHRNITEWKRLGPLHVETSHSRFKLQKLTHLCFKIRVQKHLGGKSRTRLCVRSVSTHGYFQSTGGGIMITQLAYWYNIPHVEMVPSLLWSRQDHSTQ